MYSEKIVKITKEVESAILNWVGVSTWDSNHDLDMNRFYDFVDIFQKENGNHISDVGILAETIASLAKVNTTSESFSTIKSRISTMCNILDFLRVTER